MKSTQRHHLKEDQFVHTVQDVFDRASRYRSQLMLGLIAALVLLVGLGAYAWWQQDRRASAARMLGEALAILDAPVGPAEPGGASGAYATEQAKLDAALPKLLAAADAYPTTPAGVNARYRAATTLAALGRDQEAAAQYQQVIDRAGANSFYGRMARLGQAEVQARMKNFDAAIATYRELSTSAAQELPVDGILMQLGRTYLLAGKPTEAGQAFKRITDEFATSPYASEARQELERLKG